ncbi:MAG: transglycosylase SLT domain-containing protein [Candidatus Eremiobacteraeota bacterium]|nr:transglycosylase SLT domain-containing protein [Candidatus Eremiobacteraeota bacterium]
MQAALKARVVLADAGRRCGATVRWLSTSSRMVHMKFRKSAYAVLLLTFLYGCSDAGYLPYAPHALAPAELQSIVGEAAARNSVPPALANAIVMAESGGNPSAISPSGAQGLMQLMPGTAATYHVFNPFDPRANVDGGTRYLRDLLTRYGNNVTLAVAAYNAGPAAVDSYHGVPPYAETRAYVERVLNAYRSY